MTGFCAPTEAILLLCIGIPNVWPQVARAPEEATKHGMGARPSVPDRPEAHLHPTRLIALTYRL